MSRCSLFCPRSCALLTHSCVLCIRNQGGIDLCETVVLQWHCHSPSLCPCSPSARETLMVSCIYLSHWPFHQYILFEPSWFEVKTCVHFSSKKSHRSQLSEALNLLWTVFCAQTYLKWLGRRGLGAFLPLQKPSVTGRLNVFFHMQPVLFHILST